MIVIALLFSSICTYFDYKTGKIPNRLILTFLFAALLVRMILQGINGIAMFLIGGASGFIFFPIWLLGGLKAGDIKMIIVIGALRGTAFCIGTGIYSIIIGGVVSAIILLHRKNGTEAFSRLFVYFKNMILTKRFYTYQAKDDSRVPFAGFIAMGAVASYLYPIF